MSGSWGRNKIKEVTMSRLLGWEGAKPVGFLLPQTAQRWSYQKVFLGCPWNILTWNPPTTHGWQPMGILSLFITEH